MYEAASEGQPVTVSSGNTPTQTRPPMLSAGTHRSPSPNSVVKRLVGTIPTVCVLVALGAILYWGHYTGWRLPAGMGTRDMSSAERMDWCAEHSVPEDVCVVCKPELLPQTHFGWCGRHGVSDCLWEHPEVAQLSSLPAIDPNDLLRAEQALALAKRPQNNHKCTLYLRPIQFASQTAFEKSGIEMAPVGRATITETVTAYGEVTYDRTRVAHLSSRLSGTVWRVEKQAGDPVQKGDVVALIDAAEVGKLKADLIQAQVQVNLKNRLLENLRAATGAIAQRQVIETEAALQEAQAQWLLAQQALVNLGLPLPKEINSLMPNELHRQLQFLGLPPHLIATLDPATTSSNLLPIFSPLDGTVIERHVVPGEVVDSTNTLFVIADVRQMWITLDVRLEDAERVRLGQAVKFRPDGSDQEVQGVISWKSTAADENTRTVKIRATVDNSAGRLHAFTFGTGQIIVREAENTIVVPNDALQWDGCCWVVFVRDKNFHQPNGYKVFHVRQVRIGVRDDRHTEILAGVVPGEYVATVGSSVARAELLKANLGAGCGDCCP